jgi:peptidoglycan glycosyltransferase
MSSGREIGRLLWGVLGVFALVTLAVSYWVVSGQETILQREDNPRVVEFNSSILRGAIYDRYDVLLTQTIALENDTTQRVYDNEAFYGALGYYSFRYGSGGVEASYDSVLSGANLARDMAQFFQEDVLHQARVGSDIRLTLDSVWQTRVYGAMNGQSGAVIVLDADNGELLSMVSLPTYNPNTLDAEWESLTQASGKPFFNRVLQGNYQAGGLLQTPLMAAAFLSDYVLDATMRDASTPVMVADVSLGCALQPPSSTLTLLDAYAYGCPRAFATLIEASNPTTLRHLVGVFHLNQLPTIADFATQTGVPTEATPEVTAEAVATMSVIDDLLGQGQVTVNPLAVAQMVSAILNDGDAPTLRLLLATRAPQATDWQDLPLVPSSQALMTDATARQLREWMLRNSQLIGVRDSTIGSHVAIAYSGESAQVWYVGFQEIDGQKRVIVVVIEDTTDVQRALQTAMKILMP